LSFDFGTGVNGGSGEETKRSGVGFKYNGLRDKTAKNGARKEAYEKLMAVSSK